DLRLERAEPGAAIQRIDHSDERDHALVCLAEATHEVEDGRAYGPWLGSPPPHDDDFTGIDQRIAFETVDRIRDLRPIRRFELPGARCVTLDPDGDVDLRAVAERDLAQRPHDQRVQGPV